MLPSALSAKTGVEQSEALHHSCIVGLVFSEMMRHEQQLRIVRLEVGYDLCTADIRTAIIELTRDRLARDIADSWQRLHPSTPENPAERRAPYCRAIVIRGNACGIDANQRRAPT